MTAPLRIRTTAALTLAGAIALASPSAASATTAAAAPPASEAIVAGIERRLSEAEAEGFGGAVIVQRGGQVLLSRGYGYADRERRVPFTTETIAQVGSITKSQTGAALATLVAEGKVSLSDPVSKHVPEAPEPGRSRTVAQLVAHGSGLIDTCTGDFQAQPETMLVKTCLAKPLAHAPGGDNYSNMGYSVLALIVQRAARRPWEEAVRERVWRPFGLTDIGFAFEPPSDDRFAHGYRKNEKQPVISDSIAELGGEDWALRGNGGVQASAQAMMRFLNGLVDGNPAFPEEARKMILSPLPGQSGNVREGFGLAFRYEEDGTPIRVGHAGSDGVFFSYVGWLRKNDVRLYFVGNNGEEEVRPVLQDVLRAALQIPPDQ